MSISIKVKTTTGQTCTLEGLSPEDPVENLMTLIEVELSIPMHTQRLVYQGKPLVSTNTLASQGITKDTTIHLGSLHGGAPQQAQQPLPMAGGGGSVNIDLQQQVSNLFGSPAGAIEQPQSQMTQPRPTSIDEQVRQLFQNPQNSVQQRQQTQNLLTQQPAYPVDPMDPEYQRRMMEEIEKKNMQENLEQAMEHTPEAFGRVVMLYVKSTVNKVPLTAFVDSGAQMTIMNEATAERCGLMRLLDRRFSGMAKGVGSGKILGRIHMAMVELAGIYVPMSITVLESQDMEFLIGLDQLRRHRMCIDMEKCVLRLQEKELPFLGEGELPKHFRDNVDPNSPTGPVAGGSSGGNSFPTGNTADGGDGAGAPRTPPPSAQAGDTTLTTAAAPIPQGESSSSSPMATQGGASPAPALDSRKEEKVSNLMQLSQRPRVEVIGALEACEWNEDIAVGLLFE